MEFVHVPAGEFTMGSSEAQVDAALEMCNASRGNCERALFEDETPQHQVTLGDYWIGQTEVTNAQFHAFVEGGGYDDRSLWTEAGWQWRTDIGVTQPYCWDNPDWNQPDHPVVCVSWYEAVAYTRWLTREAGREFRLPTEAEWEKAARGTDGRVWPWGETPPDGSRANICDANCEEAWKEESIDDSFALTAPVGSFPQGASPYGALDMAGNVWEWTGSLYQPYPYDAADGREDLEAEGGRTLRGGGFGDFDDYVRCAFRGYFNPDLRGYAVGFRVMSPGAAGREEDAAAAPILAPTRTSTPTRTPVPTLTRPPATTPSPTETPVASSDATASSAGAVETWIEPISGMEFVHVPAGEFTMGSTDEQVFQTWTVCAAIHWSCDKAFFEGEAPQHSVLVDDYWIGLTEVTNAQFRPFVEGGGYADQSLWTGVGWRWRTGNGVTQPGYWNDAKWNQPDHPVVGVSWFEAAAYTRWLTRESGQEFRLPTEAEWEKACRGTDGRTYPWGDEPPDADRANFDDDAGSTTAVGSYPAGAGPYGALDMAGNVWEWTGSLDQPYPYDAADGREDPEATSNRTLRGGAFYGNVAFVRCAYRLDDNPVDVDYGIGFRVLSPGF